MPGINGLPDAVLAIGLQTWPIVTYNRSFPANTQNVLLHLQPQPHQKAGMYCIRGHSKTTFAGKKCLSTHLEQRLQIQKFNAKIKISDTL